MFLRMTVEFEPDFDQRDQAYLVIDLHFFFYVAFVEDNATMSSIRYFENNASYFVQNRRKETLLNSFPCHK